MKHVLSILALLIIACVVAVYLFPAHSKPVQASVSLHASIAQSVTRTQRNTPLHSTNPYSVVGQPTMTAAQVDRVLQNAGSPAQGTGTAVYALSLKYGIDDAFAVAFFQHESTFGTRGEAQSSLSPGNLRCIPDAACVNTSGQPCQTEQSCYAAFPTWEAGFEAWYQLIRTLYVDIWHLTTIEQIIPRYAPNADHNDEANYISSVEASVAAFREVQG